MADWNEIKDILLGLLAVFIVIMILSPGIRNSFMGIFSIANKYGAPKLDFTNTYLFTAERVDLDNSANQCTPTKTDANGFNTEWSCPKGMPQNFNVFIKNSGSRMLTFRGGTVICKSGTKDCCGTTSTPSSNNGEYDCSIIPGKEESCAAGSYTFDGTYKEYEVHPLSQCVMDSTDGCYNAGMSSPIPSCNPNKYIIVKMI